MYFICNVKLIWLSYLDIMYVTQVVKIMFILINIYDVYPSGRNAHKYLGYDSEVLNNQYDTI